jgi:hypothetical protein
MTVRVLDVSARRISIDMGCSLDGGAKYTQNGRAAASVEGLNPARTAL